MLNLDDVKKALMIDFDDQDQFLSTLLSSSIGRAESISGMGIYDCIGDMKPEAKQAILDDVAVMYQNRGETSTGSTSSLATYRRLSKRPMI